MVTFAAGTDVPSTVLAAATALPFAVAWDVLGLAPPLNVRAPANTAASAAFCVWVLATITIPRSIARAMKPNRATIEMATYGKTTPRRALVLTCIRIILSLSLSIGFTQHHGGALKIYGRWQKPKSREKGSKLGIDLDHDGRLERRVVPDAVGRWRARRVRVYLNNHHVGRTKGVAGRILKFLVRQVLNNGVLNHGRVLRVCIRHGLSGPFPSGIVHQLAQHEVTTIIVDGQSQRQRDQQHKCRFDHGRPSTIRKTMCCEFHESSSTVLPVGSNTSR